jgi:Flp pilus assembly protein TadG
MRPRRYTESEGRKKGISKDGSAIIEFAFVAILFFMLIFGIIEFGRLMLMYHHVGNAAREGTRWAIVRGSTTVLDGGIPATAADIQDHVRSISPIDPNDVIVSTTWPDGNKNPGSRVNVRVDYPFSFTLPIWFGPMITLESTSQMVISY